MDIVLKEVGKRFRYDWILRNINFTFQSGKIYGIKGPNGSGKSTLLKILSAHLSPSKGKVSFSDAQKEYTRDQIYKHVSYAAPYIDVIEEFTLEEGINFHKKFKPLLQPWTTAEFLDLIDLERAGKKEIENFSSGMKQRVKLGLAICSKSSYLLLDEPNTNLDKQGMEWFTALLKKYQNGRTVVIASNEEKDFELCDEVLDVMDFKG